MNEKVQENRVRRLAARQGLQLLKSRRRDPLAIDFGGYMLTDAASNAVVAGGAPLPYSMSLDDAEAWVTREARPLPPGLARFLRELRRRVQLAEERIEMMQSGKMGVRENTGAGWVDVTDKAIEMERRMIATDAAVIAEWDPTGVTASG